MQPRVLDLSHHNSVHDFAAVAAHGVWGIIHKASQGTNYADPEYMQRRSAARYAGLLWGAYHFCTGESVVRQMDWFLAKADPRADELVALDFEDWRISQMSISQLVDASMYIEQKIGRAPAIYSGNTLKEAIVHGTDDEVIYLGRHRLWLAQYGEKTVCPEGFAAPWLWQYSDGNIGPGPHGVPGVGGQVDLNAYDGSLADLRTEWAGEPLATS